MKPDGKWRLLPHEHSLKARPHRHTSYPGLLLVLVLVGAILGGFTFTADAATPAVNPQTGSIGLQGAIQGPPPSQAAVITNPRNGQHTSSIPITVSGTCPVNTFVLITKNGTFAGATDCADDGTFSLQSDLFIGSNQLVARVSDALGQFGPDSVPVTVFYDAPGVTIPGGFVGQQLFLETDSTVVGVSPNQSVCRTVTIVGGVGPYAVSFDWDDGQTSLVSQTTAGPVKACHSYSRPGNYNVIVKVSDSAGNAAFLQVVTVVNGPTNNSAASQSNGTTFDTVLLTAWPLYVLALLLVLTFWLGERREDRKLRREGKLVA